MTNQEIVAVLRKLEWMSWDDEPLCPICSSSMPRLKKDRDLGHDYNCRLARAIRELTNRPQAVGEGL
jgi:predicted RNA-binding Zn-ribbon protein involved in translation (DUF1610 family)